MCACVCVYVCVCACVRACVHFKLTSSSIKVQIKKISKSKSQTQKSRPETNTLDMEKHLAQKLFLGGWVKDDIVYVAWCNGHVRLIMIRTKRLVTIYKRAMNPFMLPTSPFPQGSVECSVQCFSDELNSS